MKKIILKKLTLLNFKGVANFTLTPHTEGLTSVRAANGKGKTSTFDAWLWLLFGKNSEGASQFSIKTLDENNKVIPKLPHEVSAEIEVDGEIITLRRVLEEKWTKHRGEVEEVFEGNKEAYFVNDVPFKKGEYASKIAEICDEEVFKLVTSPSAFTSLPWQKQRDMLFSMAGMLSDEELAKSNPDYEALLEHLTNKSLDEYKKEVSAKRKKVKTEVDGLPLRIDEVNRSIPPVQDWVGMEAQLKEKQLQITEIDDLLSDLGKSQTAAHAEHDKLLKQISDIKQKINDRTFDIKSSVQKDYFEAARKRSELNNQIIDLESKKRHTEVELETAKSNIDACASNREALLKTYYTINAEVFSVDESMLECPTCHRPFEADEIDRIKADALAKFNASKAERLAKNKEAGLANKQRAEGYTEAQIKLCAEIDAINAKIEAVKADPAFTLNTEVPDTTDAIKADKQIQELTATLAKLQDEADKPVDIANEDERNKLRTEKSGYEAEVRELAEKLAVRKQIQKGMERKMELEDQLRTLAQGLANLEKMEFTIQQFNRARIDAVSDKINSMFTMVKFRLVDEQLNGGTKDNCVALVNGVDFADVNQAGQVLAGLDILQAISKYFDVACPVFVDCSESVNSIPSLDNSQLIELRVTDDKELTVI